MSDAKPAAESKPKGKGKLLIFTLVGLLLVGGGGAGAYWRFFRQAPESVEADEDASGHEEGGDEHEGAPKKKKKGAKHEAEARGIIPLEPFVVNLADKDAARFLRTSLKLVVDEEINEEKLEEEAVKIAQVRSAILEVLTVQTSTALVTPEGKAELKKHITEEASEILDTEVSDVLFADFVVQF